ncbi:hypothetical protein FRC09_012292 [Ceratobasidium sp. 395]|nr:hypothetical protein FRC09_012292 [Ceratobasidium sp. 395]
MLAKLRQRFRHIKSVFRGRPRSTNNNWDIDTGLEENLCTFDWTGLDTLIDALDRNAEAFQLLATAVAKLSTYIKKLETHTQVPNGYGKIRINMDDLFLQLSTFVNASESCTVKQGRAVNLARSINKEMDPLLQLEQNWLDVNTRDVKRRSDEVLKHVYRLQALMGHFVVSN